MITDNFNCGNCDFFLPVEGLQRAPESALIAMPAATAQPEPDAGHCRKDPPQIAVQSVANPLHPGQVQQMVQRFHPPMKRDEICSHHSALSGRTLQGAIRYAIRAWQNRDLEYQPGTYPDESAAGFSRVPTLDEAKQVAGNVQQRHPFYGTDHNRPCGICGENADSFRHQSLNPEYATVQKQQFPEG